MYIYIYIYITPVLYYTPRSLQNLFNHTMLLFYKLYYVIISFIYLSIFISIYCFRSKLLYAPTRGGHTPMKSANKPY